MSPLPELKPHAHGAELVVPIKGELADDGWTFANFPLQSSEVSVRLIERYLHGLGWSRSESKRFAGSLFRESRTWLTVPVELITV